VLEQFHSWIQSGAGGAKGWVLEEENHEGWRVSIEEGEGKKGWVLLRASLHDPLLVLNVESDVPNGAAPPPHHPLLLLIKEMTSSLVQPPPIPLHHPSLPPPPSRLSCLLSSPCSQVLFGFEVQFPDNGEGISQGTAWSCLNECRRSLAQPCQMTKLADARQAV